MDKKVLVFKKQVPCSKQFTCTRRKFGELSWLFQNITA